MKIRHFFSALIAFSLVSCSTGEPQTSPAISTLGEPTQAAVMVKPQTVRPSLPSITTPQVRAESAIVIDAVTGRILFQKNARTRRAVASTQKLMTALVVSRSGPMSDPVTIVKKDTQVEPSKLYVKAGETYTREVLLKALLVKSGNDIANALARDVAGSNQAFAGRMNTMARALGMTNSNFLNPSGLTEEGQYSTALDIALLARQAQQNPFFRQCMRTRQYVFNYPDGRTRDITNTNQLLKKLPYCTGMKTGTTRASGRCLVSSGTLNGRSVIAVALGSTSKDIWNDSEKLLRWALE